MTRDNRTIQNVPAEEIQRILRTNELNDYYASIKKPERVCPVCEKTYTQQRKWQKFCTHKCKSYWAQYTRRPRLVVKIEL